MCFRPADASAGAGVNKCPECGKTVQAMGGLVIKTCPFCKCDFAPYLNGEKKIPAVLGVPGTPAAPGTPTAPKAPEIQ